MTADTLRIDTTLLQQLQADSRYDYGRDLLQVDRESLVAWLFRSVGRWLDQLFDSAPMQALGHWFWPVVGIVVLLVIAGFLYWRRGSLFAAAGKKETDAANTEDTIYGVDFDGDIAKARDAGRWNEAVRLVYLQTLRMLSDGGRIEWRPYKTPSQYQREVPTADFRLLTSHFMRIRYGGFKASAALCDEMLSLQDTITKGGDGA